jgi:hypothetical protein
MDVLISTGTPLMTGRRLPSDDTRAVFTGCPPEFTPDVILGWA